jgi:hypothetical protein
MNSYSGWYVSTNIASALSGKYVIIAKDAGDTNELNFFEIMGWSEYPI